MMNFSGSIPSILKKTFSGILLCLPSSTGVGTCADTQAAVGTSEIKAGIEYFSVLLCGFAQQIGKIP